MNQALKRLKELDAEIKNLGGVEAALGWDQQVYMPERGVHGRAEQLTTIASLRHQKETNPEIGDLLAKVGATDDSPGGDPELSERDRALVRVMRRDYLQATKLPADLVTRMARTTAVAQSVWAEARKKSDFVLFQPKLQEIVEIVLEVAECLGYRDHPYDALLDQFEPGMTTTDVSSVFRDLREGLVPLVRAISEAPQVDNSFWLKSYPVAQQEIFGRQILEAMGFDFTRGRLDVSVHPFTTTLGGDDVRITTRYTDTLFQTSLFGTIHEGGHGLYELGFDRENHGTSLADAASLGIHESMSRFWENVVGRSRSFWHHYFPILKEQFPQQLSGVDIEGFYKGINRVEPTHIRVEADEVTYSLHVILRFELERMLIGKELSVSELPDAWREQSRDLLGIAPDHDADGVLQDIHWSGGAIGYFPTYALGNVYGLQFVSAMRRDLPNMDDNLRKGELLPLKTWLDANIHRPGRSMTPRELCQSVAGEPMNAMPFIDYLTSKYTDVYDL